MMVFIDRCILQKILTYMSPRGIGPLKLGGPSFQLSPKIKHNLPIYPVWDIYEMKLTISAK